MGAYNYICIPNLNKNQTVPSRFLRANKVPNEFVNSSVKKIIKKSHIGIR